MAKTLIADPGAAPAYAEYCGTVYCHLIKWWEKHEKFQFKVKMLNIYNKYILTCIMCMNTGMSDSF